MDICITSTFQMVKLRWFVFCLRIKLSICTLKFQEYSTNLSFLRMELLRSLNFRVDRCLS